MRTGSCKFGVACKFDHPQPASLGPVLPVPGHVAFGSMAPTVVPSSGLPYVGGFPAWSLPRMPYVSSPRWQDPQSYPSVPFSPSQGIISAQGWNTYNTYMVSTDLLNWTNRFFIYFLVLKNPCIVKVLFV